MNNEDIFSESLVERLEKSFSELLSMLDEKKYRLFSEKINEMNPVDIADFFEELTKEQLPTVLGLRRFKRATARSGVLTELRKREHYEKPSVKRKKKSEAARKRKYK